MHAFTLDSPVKYPADLGQVELHYCQFFFFFLSQQLGVLECCPFFESLLPTPAFGRVSLPEPIGSGRSNGREER